MIKFLAEWLQKIELARNVKIYHEYGHLFTSEQRERLQERISFLKNTF